MSKVYIEGKGAGRTSSFPKNASILAKMSIPALAKSSRQHLAAMSHPGSERFPIALLVRCAYVKIPISTSNYARNYLGSPTLR